MDTSREKLLREVMAADFTAVDLHLYLNTHPYDYSALIIFMNIVQRGKVLRNCFENMYGPLTASASVTYPWPWIKCPWPWECQ